MKFEVEYYDYENKYTTCLEIINARADYTVEQYVKDCAENADDDWNEMLANGRVSLRPIEDEE